MKPYGIIGRLMMGCVLACCLTSKTNAQSGYAVTELGADYRVLQKTTVENGTNRIHRYTELATGMHYLNNGQWTEAQQQISIQPQGGAAAVQGRHQVYFPPDIGSGVLKVVTPDGRVLQSRPLGVTYDDGKDTVFIGVLTNAAGWLTASNQVTYRDCFTGIHADLVCTYRRGGFECDLVFREQPPTPDVYGLSDADSTVQLITEFFHTADPQQVPAASDDWFGLQDDTLKFGKMTMGQGKAFAAKAESGSRNAETATPVYKNWLHLGGRTFLVEQVPLLYLADDLDALPMTSRIEKPGTGKLKFASNTPEFPPALPMATDTNRILIAAAGLNRQPGVVLDYNVMDSDSGDFTFASGQTYFISGGVYCSGTTTIDGGAVLKFPEDGSGGLGCWGTVVCATTAYSNAVFTSMNDDSEGDIIEGSSGSPAQGGALYVDSGSGLDHCIFRYAGTAVTTSDTIYDCQFYQCYYAIVGGNITINNSLFSGCQWAIDAGPTCETCTFDSCGGVCDGAGYYYNCVFANNASLGFVWETWDPTPCYSFDGSNNYFDNPDQAFGDNVVTGSTVDAGNTTADRLGLYWWTTQGPNTMEGTSIVDLGYHYPAVDGNGNPVETEDGCGFGDDYGYDYQLDPNGYGLPDDWELDEFGSLGHYASDVDPLGNSLLYDYTNGIDFTAPIQFTVRLGNQQFNTTSAPGSYVVISGVPYYEAVLVNDTNLNDAVWNNYDGNIYLNLGPTDGVYEVWFGLKGLGASAQPTWFGTDVTLNRSKPQIFISSPVTNVVATPYIQLQGYSALPLAGVTFDESNAVVVLTNQPGQIIGHTVDTNTSSYTTDYFQCFDIPLTNGPNIITLHATDPAGNVTTTNLNILLDYTTATNPVINLAWPQNEMQICGSSFTLRGWTEDASAAVNAQITDSNGDTNVVSGVVERTGVLWVNNLPLAEGANVVTLWVTNSAGLSSMTNITVVKNDMTFAVTSVNGDLWLPTVTVNGTISGSGYAVTVNGVAATVSGNSWSAVNVPVSPGGVASFDMQANASDGGNPNANDDMNKLNEEVVYSVVANNDNSDVLGYACEQDHITDNFAFGTGGFYDEHYEAQDGGIDYVRDCDWVFAPDGSIEGGVWYDNEGYSGILEPYFFAGFSLVEEEGSLTVLMQDNFISQHRNCNTKMMQFTGGPGVIGQQVLVAVNASAGEELGHPHFLFPGLEIPSEQITIPGLGKNLGTDGWAYGVVAEGTPVDVTLTKGGVPMYEYPWPNVGTFTPSIQANDNDLDTTNPTFCVGQGISFVPIWNGDPSGDSDPPANIDAQWTLPVTFVNEQPYSYCLAYWDENSGWLTNYNFGCYYVDGSGGTCKVNMELHFPNGQSVSVSADGDFTIVKPSITKFAWSPTESYLNTNPPVHPYGNVAWSTWVLPPNGFSGTASYTQLIDRSYSYYYNVPLESPSYDSFSTGAYWLDGVGPYTTGTVQPQPLNWNDKPLIPTQFGDTPGLDPKKLLGYTCSFCNQINISDNFKTYLQFQPDGGIPVTIGRIDWSWSCEATENDGIWSWSNSASGPTPHWDDFSFPLWTNVYHGQ